VIHFRNAKIHPDSKFLIILRKLEFTSTKMYFCVFGDAVTLKKK